MARSKKSNDPKPETEAPDAAGDTPETGTEIEPGDTLAGTEGVPEPTDPPAPEAVTEESVRDDGLLDRADDQPSGPAEESAPALARAVDHVTGQEGSGADPSAEAEDDKAATESDEIRTEDDPAPEPGATADAGTLPDPIADEDPRVREEPPEAHVAPPPAEPATTTVVERRGGFLPMLLGGAVAAGIGFGLAQYLGPVGPFGGPAEPEEDPIAPLAAEQVAQADRIAAIEAGIAELGQDDGADLLQAEIASLRDEGAAAQAEVTTTLDGLGGALGALDERLTTLERQPTDDGGVTEAALASYEREIAALRETLDDVQAQIAANREELDARAADAAARQAELEAQARAAAADDLRRAATRQIETALASGEPFEAALTDLEGAADPEVIAALEPHAAGVATPQELADGFPAAARSALARARSESGTEGIGGFLQAQLGVRSVEPREGDDPDAVLSRIGAAAREGRFKDALGEIEALPETAREPLADWEARLRDRVDAEAALSRLSDTDAAN